MIGRRARVTLGGLTVGHLHEGADAIIEFRIVPDYVSMPRRPVLGQWFEDRQRAIQRGDRAGELPAFFANLVPEGDLRLILEDRLGVDPGDDLGLLCAVGSDLPGALAVQLEDGGAPRRPDRSPVTADSTGLHFSLAGVQLKFSMMKRGNRFVLPGRDERGEWIAKIAYDGYAELSANEWVTMEWARRLAFDVPATDLRPLADLVDVPYDGDPTAQVFLIQRYDRGAGGRRIHQEDFQQVVGRRPHKKYDDLTYDKLVLLATRIVGADAYEEMLRRLAFMIASGNDDAHTKNWSIIYPDGVSARLSPLYDQVFTARWPRFAVTLALKLDGAKDFAEVDFGHIRELARRIRGDAHIAEGVVRDTVEQAATAWAGLREHPAVTDGYREALRRHWQRVPLLRAHALLI